ncbi:MAG: GNAT family N-acetyltransferase [Methanotrichaceae archaeon]
MIEIGRLMRNKDSPLKRDVNYEMGFLGEGRLQELIELQDTIIQGLPDPEIFWTHPIDYFREIFKVDRSVIGVSTEDGLIAYSLIYIPRERKSQEGCENLGRDIDLSDDELKRAAHLQATVVNPAYRGNSLQRRMARQHLEVLKEMGYEHIFCTVSPKNPMSLRNILMCGFVIRGLKRKFNGWWRYILYKNVSCPFSFGSDEMKIDSSDIEGQIDLVCRGYIGCSMELLPNGFSVTYCKGQAPRD